MALAADRTREFGSDPELLAEMARGDREALAELYERHAPALCALARQILRQQAEAEDLLHDVFLEVWRHASDYDETRGSVWTWLAVRTRSRALDRRRSAQFLRRVELTDAEIEELASPRNDQAGQSSDGGRVREALHQMSEPERQVLLLGYFEGLTSAEIATRFQIPVGTVKSRTRSALAKLRSWFALHEAGA
ncbi:MAG TPA: sigma-70 family RNA polymerase sigma factor [Polyangiaceae bacterium]|nr:sigma-70 family RNA polymerase sigma factor [Polyangiaceae bacterium]